MMKILKLEREFYWALRFPNTIHAELIIVEFVKEQGWYHCGSDIELDQGRDFTLLSDRLVYPQ